MTEMWNSVEVYGPQSAIDRFRRLCIVSDGESGGTLTIAFDRIAAAPLPAPRNADELPPMWRDRDAAWNFREWGANERGVYKCAFDTGYWFPTPILERLCLLFPSLSFDCECIAGDDSSMGYGWFNKPPGGDDFRDDYPVPKDYWTTGPGTKRRGEAQRRHEEVVAKLTRVVGRL